MKMSMSGQMRLEQRMKLAPRMIQSMEILQLPLLALQEKIEQELSGNPVLEQVEPEAEADETPSDADAGVEEQKTLVVKEDNDKVDNFQRLDTMDTDYDDYYHRAESMRPRRDDGEPDKKLEAMQNTAALQQSLNEYLIEQWRMVEAEPAVKTAGSMIIDYIDERGYLTVRLEQLYNKDKPQITLEHLQRAIDLVQRLEPAGVGARDMKECLLIQMAQSGEDMSFDEQLVSEHLDELLENRLPDIARKMNCRIEQINTAIARLSKLDTSPGLRVGRNDNHPIVTDVIIEPDEHGGYDVRLADTRLPSLRVNDYYAKMSRDKSLDEKTREFLQKNIRSASWLMEAIEQRKNTLLKVARVIVEYQKEFLEKGQLFLKPLPMAKVAAEVGVHIATISRAVAGKYAQSPQGVLPLRGFFSGGMDNKEGETRSWDAVRARMQQIVDDEDKNNPL
ncbi:MAG: RNA polymerase factor sigma-54, partial [Sedimentisphaerales bacterium]|nr:RNA polymerase factor sigma-54 [Sedimentisphaerales bacterium]